MSIYEQYSKHFYIQKIILFTLTLSKWIIHVPDALIPSLSSGFATVNPGVSRSTKNVVMPRYPYLKDFLLLYDNIVYFLTIII